MTARHRVVIVGGGFAGLAATKALRSAPVDVTVVDRQAHHLFQPLLYQVATGVLSQGNVAPPLRDILRHQRNADVVLAEVDGIDLERRAVRCRFLDRMWELAYDSLIVAAGSAQSYFGHDEFAVHAPGMKTIDDALEVRGRIFGAFEAAELEEDAARRVAWLTFVVVGAGPTGVEMAVRTGTLVTGMDAAGVELKTSAGVERLPATTKIWSAGVQASPLASTVAAQAAVELTRAGQVTVMPDCSLPGHADVFVVGDLMALDGSPGSRRSRSNRAGTPPPKSGGALPATHSRGRSGIGISAASPPSRATTRSARAAVRGSGDSPGGSPGSSSTSLGLLVTGIASGLLISRYGRYRPFPIIGTATATVGLYLLSRLDVSTATSKAAGYLLVLGVGLALRVQVLVLAAQNAVDYRLLGVATSASSLARQVGGSIGVSVFGAIFTNRLAHELAQRLPPGAHAPAHGSPAAVHHLPPVIHAAYLAAYAAALHPVFLTAAAVMLGGFALS
jgi:NADH:ubiquinone reductase (H+-translocating)